MLSEKGRVISPDAHPENGYFYRSDHISLAKKGVPMLYADRGEDLVTGGREAGEAFGKDYTDNRYHSPADEFSDSWNMDGISRGRERRLRGDQSLRQQWRMAELV